MEIEKEFIQPPEAPVFDPTPEEFQDPVSYIAKIRPVAEQAGICRIRPPASWQPPFAVDIDNFRFTPRIQKLNELEANTRIKLNFLERLTKFWELQGVKLKIPLVEKKYLDVYRLHKAVCEEGGFEVVSKEKKWAKIVDHLCYQPGRGTGNILRQYYEKSLYPYDIFLAGATTDNKAESVTDGVTVKLEKDSTGSNQPLKKDSVHSKSDSNLLLDSGSAKKLDFTLNNELKKLQFFGAGPKTALPDATVICIDDSSSNEGSDLKVFRRRIRAKRSATHGGSLICRSCNKGGSSEDILICDGCNDAYHNDCLIHPLHEMPRGDWRCAKCIAQECNKPTEVYGFELGKREYTLQSFGEMADQFKLDYFGMAIHMVPCKLVEKEFWRLVNSIDEDVVVEYGADNPSSECGSGFPTEKTRNMFPDDEEYIRSPWNLNNLAVLKQCVLHYINAEISGMKVPWCYVGMVFSSFAWHIEDHWNYSINYLHWGEPKTWYGVPSSKAQLFEEVMMRNAPELFEQSPDLLHQLTTLMDPNTLMSAGVPIVRTDQHAGEFVITFPRAYHSGFNQGYNFAEAVNFSLADWLPMGRACVEHYRLHRRQCVFSHDELVCRMASLPPDSLDLTMSVMVYRDMLTMIDDEKKLRKQLLNKGTVIAEKEAFELLPDDERQCAICKTTCFLSAVTCSCTEGKMVCIHHASKLCHCPPSQHCLRYRYTLDELLGLISRLKESHQEFEQWARRAKCALDATDTQRLDLLPFKELITEAHDREFPSCPLLEALQMAVNEAEKCASVVHQIIENKVCTRQRESGDSKYAVKLTVEQLDGFYKQISTLPCRIKEQSTVLDWLDKIHQFQSDVQREIGGDLLNLSQLEKLLEFEVPRDLEVPEMAVLKQAVLQAKWLDDVHNSLLPGTLSSIDVDKVRRLIQAGVGLGNHVSCERAMSELQQLLTASDQCEQKALQCLSAKPPHDISKLKAVIEESKMFSLLLPSVVALTDAIKAAKNWTSQVESLLDVCRTPSLSAVDDLIAKGHQIPVLLEYMTELESRSLAGHAWLDKTSRSFLIKKTDSLLQVLSPRSDLTKFKELCGSGDEPSNDLVPTFTDQAASKKLLTLAGERELTSMLRLRDHNRLKSEQGGTTYCICRRVRSGTMVLCQLCRDLYHAECVSYVEQSQKGVRGAESGSRGSRNRSLPLDSSVDMQPYFCPLCARSRRPSFAELLAVLVSLQKLNIWLPEGIAIQLLAERAIKWLEEVRQVLDSEDVTTVRSLQVDSPNLLPSQMRQLFEKTVMTLDRLMVEGDLLEVTIEEKTALRDLLRTVRPADYSQIVYGFPDILSDGNDPESKRDGVRRVKRKGWGSDKKAEKGQRKKRQSTKGASRNVADDNSDEFCSAEKCLRPSGEDIGWVQCDKCELWFHFRCIGVDSISEHDEYICKRCTRQQTASTSSTSTAVCRIINTHNAVSTTNSSAHQPSTSSLPTFNAESDSDSDDDDDDEGDEQMREFYSNECIDSYIIRSRHTSPPPVASHNKSGDVILFE